MLKPSAGQRFQPSGRHISSSEDFRNQPETPKIRGIQRPVGEDWSTIRTDGIGLLDVRATIETHERSHLRCLHRRGGSRRRRLSQVSAGCTSPRVPLRVAPRFQTTHPTYQWLNRLQCLNIGEADLERFEVRYDVYAIRLPFGGCPCQHTK
jgi:Protein of unknown function (DUF3237)